ncbi:MAG: hypothetical protein WC333_03810 [Dehalococcoidia bacterium]|jgi:predicted membrane protein
MENEPEMSTDTGWKKHKTASIIMIWTGVVGFIVSLIVFISLLSDIDNFEEAIVLFILMVGFGLLTIIGAILFFVSRSQPKKQKNQKSL